MKDNKNTDIGVFEHYLTVWVILCIVIGIAIGRFLPNIPQFLMRFEYANVSIPISLLIWGMIYPMMLKIDFVSIKDVGKNPKGLFITWAVNWLIKPFTMFGIAYLFFNILFANYITSELAKGYFAGAVLLGAAPCTAMVFVWSHLTKGNAAYTLIQVATNDLIIIIAYVPIVGLLLNVSGISIPFDTLILSVLLFVVIPLLGGVFTRRIMVRNKGKHYFENRFIPRFKNMTVVGLLLTLVIVFSFQGSIILQNPLHIGLIAIPLIMQTLLMFFIAYSVSKALGLPHNIAAPAGMIGASNFFELSVVVAITLFGMNSPAVLATTVGVLVEVPLMLVLVSIANKTRDKF
ncbi:MAG: ACR3 family arsenite efflux transporter [Dehalococcoidia bacterium]|nr:ACR3 family arsenite efflux transporter [Dehalococcoidia bacterium]